MFVCEVQHGHGAWETHPKKRFCITNQAVDHVSLCTLQDFHHRHLSQPCTSCWQGRSGSPARSHTCSCRAGWRRSGCKCPAWRIHWYLQVRGCWRWGASSHRTFLCLSIATFNHFFLGSDLHTKRMMHEMFLSHLHRICCLPSSCSLFGRSSWSRDSDRCRFESSRRCRPNTRWYLRGHTRLTDSIHNNCFPKCGLGTRALKPQTTEFRASFPPACDVAELWRLTKPTVWHSVFSHAIIFRKQFDDKNNGSAYHNNWVHLTSRRSPSLCCTLSPCWYNRRWDTWTWLDPRRCSLLNNKRKNKVVRSGFTMRLKRRNRKHFQ